MGVRGLARVLGVTARRGAPRPHPHVPLFSSALPEEAAGLERAINLARVVGVPLVAIAIASGQLRSPLAPAFVAMLALISVYVALALRRTAVPPVATRIVFSVGDVLIVGLAQLMTVDEDPWTAPAASLLAIIVIALRSGRGGALLSAAAASLILPATAAYRSAVAGLPTTPTTVGAWITFYCVCALVMSAAMRELVLLRQRQRQQRDRDLAMLQVQSDLGEMLLVTDGERILETNRAVSHLIGRDLDGTTPPLSELFGPEDVARIRARAQAGTTDQFEATLRGRDGRRSEIEMAVKAVQRDGGRVIAIARDITERKRVERALEDRVLHDQLTGLAGRALLRDRIDRAIASVRSPDATVTVLMLDVAHFRHVNDTLGFRAGDALLRALAARLNECARPSDTVARISGDEFAMLLDAGGPKRSERVTAAILRALEQPVSLEGSSVAIDVSIGSARYPDHGADADTLLRHAEFAMYEAKLAGTRSATYAPEHGTTAPSQLVVAEIRSALERDEIVLFYQPQVRLDDGAPVGVEALARWRHPRLGLVMPSEFIPLIEGTALWRAFSDRMLLKALSDRASWPEPHRSLRLAVNLSGRDLLDPTLPGTVRAFLAGGERSLTVEVTERGLGSEPAEIRPTLSALSALGVSFSIDDFGTGSSSLSHLVDLPVSEVKVDRSFVSAMGTDPKHRAIVQATVELAHAVGSSVTAEGIEDAATWALLAQMGCDAAQGYFVSRPMPSDEVVSWMTAKWQPTLGARN